MLQEKGMLQDLKKKWWVEQGGGLCASIEQEPTSSSELGLANVGGVFLVLLIGTCGSFVIAVFEFLWNVRKVAVKEKVRLKNRYLTLGSFSFTPTAETSEINFPPRRAYKRNDSWSRNNSLLNFIQ